MRRKNRLAMKAKPIPSKLPPHSEGEAFSEKRSDELAAACSKRLAHRESISIRFDADFNPSVMMTYLLTFHLLGYIC